MLFTHISGTTVQDLPSVSRTAFCNRTYSNDFHPGWNRSKSAVNVSMTRYKIGIGTQSKAIPLSGIKHRSKEIVRNSDDRRIQLPAADDLHQLFVLFDRRRFVGLSEYFTAFDDVQPISDAKDVIEL